MKRQSVLKRAFPWIVGWMVFVWLLAVPPAAAQQVVDQLPADARLLTASPVDSALVYSVVGRTLYRSEDGSRTWLESATLPSVATALQPANHDTALLYAGTESAGVLRSFDRGQTWQAISDGLGMTAGAILEVSALALAPNNDQLIYAATGYWLGNTTLHFSPNAVLFSPNGGANWLPLAGLGLNAQRITALAAQPDRPLTVRATFADGQSHMFTADASVLAQLTTAPAAPAAQRAAAAQALGLLGDPAGIPALLEALHSSDVPVVARAAEALGVLRAAEAVPALAELLAGEPVAPSAVAQALAAIGTPAALDALVAALNSEAMTPARHAVMAALEQLGSRATPALLATLSKGAPAAQRNAAEMLGWIGDPAAVADLLAALNNADASVRAQAAWALGEIGDPAAWSALAAAAESDANTEVRLLATSALSRLPDPPTVTVPTVPARGALAPRNAASPAGNSSVLPLPDWLAKAMPALRYVILALVLAFAALLPWYQDIREERRRRHN